MYHSFEIKGDDNYALKTAIISQTINDFIKSLENTTTEKKVEGFDNTETSKGWFMNSFNIIDNDIFINCASNNNSGLLLSLATGLVDTFNVELKYNFNCPKSDVSGQVVIDKDSFESVVFTSYEDISSFVTESIQTRQCLNKILCNAYVGAGFITELVSEEDHVSLGMPYKEIKFKIKSKKEELYFLITCDKILNPDDYECIEIISIDGDSYHISSVSWNESVEFKIEKTLSEIKKNMIISNLFGIAELAA